MLIKGADVLDTYTVSKLLFGSELKKSASFKLIHVELQSDKMISLID